MGLARLEKKSVNGRESKVCEGVSPKALRTFTQLAHKVRTSSANSWNSNELLKSVALLFLWTNSTRANYARFLYLRIPFLLFILLLARVCARIYIISNTMQNTKPYFLSTHAGFGTFSVIVVVLKASIYNLHQFGVFCRKSNFTFMVVIITTRIGLCYLHNFLN